MSGKWTPPGTPRIETGDPWGRIPERTPRDGQENRPGGRLCLIGIKCGLCGFSERFL
nr:MAG TPA: hypothetical protein [Caudoviricetes sp.]